MSTQRKMTKPKNKTIVIGLTGGVGMGKTTAAQMFAAQGLWVFDADACVHDLLENNKAVRKALANKIPAFLGHKGNTDRAALSAWAFSSPRNIKALEALLHPFVWKARDAFLKKARAARIAGVVLDVPLLFETGADRGCDHTLCVFTDAKTQKERVLKRKGMTARKLSAIKARQWTMAKKRAAADVTLDMSMTKRQAAAVIAALWKQWTMG